MSDYILDLRKIMGHRPLIQVGASVLVEDEKSTIECSDGQSVILKKYTMHDRELAADCAELFIRTGGHYPGMEWLKFWQGSKLFKGYLTFFRNYGKLPKVIN